MGHMKFRQKNHCTVSTSKEVLIRMVGLCCERGVAIEDLGRREVGCGESEGGSAMADLGGQI